MNFNLSGFSYINKIEDLTSNIFNGDWRTWLKWWNEHDNGSLGFSQLTVGGSPLPDASNLGALLEIVNTGQPVQVFKMSSYGAVANLTGQNNMHFVRVNGSPVSPSATLSGDLFLSMGFRGHDGTVLTGSAGAFQAIATQNWTGTAYGIKFEFQACANGSTNRITVLDIDANNGIIFSNGLGIKGTTTNDNATAGNNGEFVQSFIASGSAVSLSTANTAVNITSISLTAGDWDISAMVTYSPNTVNLNASNPYFDGWFCATSASYTGANYGDNLAETPVPSGAAGSVFQTVTIPPWRTSIASTTTYYLNAAAGSTYTSGSPKAFGRISARRVR